MLFWHVLPCYRNVLLHITMTGSGVSYNTITLLLLQLCVAVMVCCSHSSRSIRIKVAAEYPWCTLSYSLQLAFMRVALCYMWLKGALDNFSLIPNFFKKVENFYIIRSVFQCSGCMQNLTCRFNLVTEIYALFFQKPFLKVNFKKWLPLSWLLNLAPSTIILVLSILQLFVQFYE